MIEAFASFSPRAVLQEKEKRCLTCSVILYLLIGVSAACQSDTDSMAENHLERPFSLYEAGRPHSHGRGFLTMNIRGSRLFQVSYSNDAIGIYAVESDGSLSRIGFYQSSGDDLADLSGAARGQLSQDEQFFFVTAFDSNALLVFSINSTTADLTLTQTYHDGDLLDNTRLQLKGASDLLFHPTGQFLYVTAYNSDAWTAFKVNGSTLYEPEVQQSEATSGASHLAVSLDGNLLFVSAGKAGNLLVHNVGWEGEISAPDVYHHNTALDGRNQSLADASAMMLSSDGRHLYVVSDSEGTVSVYYIPARGALSLRTVYLLDSMLDDMLDSTMPEFDAASMVPYGRFRLCSNPDRRFLYLTDTLDNSLTVWQINLNGTLSFQQEYPDSEFLPMAGGGSAFLSRRGEELYLVGNHSVSLFAIVPPQLPYNSTRALSECLDGITELNTRISLTQSEIDNKSHYLGALRFSLQEVEQQTADLKQQTAMLESSSSLDVLGTAEARLQFVLSIISRGQMHDLISQLAGSLNSVNGLISMLPQGELEDNEKQQYLSILQSELEKANPLIAGLKQQKEAVDALGITDIVDALCTVLDVYTGIVQKKAILDALDARLIIAERDRQLYQTRLTQTREQLRPHSENNTDEQNKVLPVNAWQIATGTIGVTVAFTMVSIACLVINRHLFKYKTRITNTGLGGVMVNNPLYLDPADVIRH